MFALAYSNKSTKLTTPSYHVVVLTFLFLRQLSLIFFFIHNPCLEMTKPYRKKYIIITHKIFTVAVGVSTTWRYFITLFFIYLAFQTKIYNHPGRPHFVDYFLYLVLSVVVLS